jgi:integrase/recombinase XerD
VDVADLGGWRYRSTLQVLGKGDKPALIVLNLRTYYLSAIDGRAHGPLLLNRAQRRMQRHNAAAIIRCLATTAGIAGRLTPHALRRSYITIGLLQGAPLRRCNALPATPRPTPPSVTTNPNGHFTRI